MRSATCSADISAGEKEPLLQRQLRATRASRASTMAYSPKMTSSISWGFCRPTAAQMTNLGDFSSGPSRKKTLSLLFLSAPTAQESSVSARRARPSLKISGKIKSSPSNKSTSIRRTTSTSFPKKNSRTRKDRRGLRLNRWHHRRCEKSNRLS